MNELGSLIVTDKGSRKDVYLPEILIETTRVGKSLRVIAIDPTTAIEVTMINVPRC